MAGFSLNIKGLNEAISRLDAKKFKQNIQDAFDAFGQVVVKDAKISAPTDEGLLKRSINTDQIPFGANISVNVDYAAYVEFGTRKFAAKYVATLPPDWKSFAAEFKGKTGGSGSFMSFFYTILKWVQRKGIAAEKTKSGKRSNSRTSIQNEYDAAYMIALSIIRNGIKPHPFLYPAIEKNTKQLIKDIEEAI